MLYRMFFSRSQDLVRQLLNRNSAQRLTAAQALEHPWLHTSSDILSKIDLSQSLDQLRFFNATRKLRAAIHAVSDGDGVDPRVRRGGLNDAS